MAAWVERNLWAEPEALYDDGGFSGGTMERPALKRLIADIEAGEAVPPTHERLGVFWLK